MAVNAIFTDYFVSIQHVLQSFLVPARWQFSILACVYETFLFVIILYFGWKFVKKTKIVSLEEMDVYVFFFMLSYPVYSFIFAARRITSRVPLSAPDSLTKEPLLDHVGFFLGF